MNDIIDSGRKSEIDINQVASKLASMKKDYDELQKNILVDESSFMKLYRINNELFHKTIAVTANGKMKKRDKEKALSTTKRLKGDWKKLLNKIVKDSLKFQDLTKTNVDLVKKVEAVIKR